MSNQVTRVAFKAHDEEERTRVAKAHRQYFEQYHSGLIGSFDDAEIVTGGVLAVTLDGIEFEGRHAESDLRFCVTWKNIIALFTRRRGELDE